jgi:stage II sporulation protein D
MNIIKKAGLMTITTIAAMSLAGVASAQTTSATTFTRNLTIGSVGEDVLALQKFLNNNGYTLATSGPGSPGNETTYFGILTRDALAKFQMANSIAPAAGFFGPATRARVTAIMGGTGSNGTNLNGTTGTTGTNGTNGTTNTGGTGGTGGTPSTGY